MNGRTQSFSKVDTKFRGGGHCRRDPGKGLVEIQAIGAGAANQAIKSVAIARGYLAPAGIDLICKPAFANVEIDGAERTAIKLIVEPR